MYEFAENNLKFMYMYSGASICLDARSGYRKVCRFSWTGEFLPAYRKLEGSQLQTGRPEPYYGGIIIFENNRS